MQKIYLFLFLLVIQPTLFAQNLTLGTINYQPNATDGYVLIAPMGRTDSYLIDNCGRVINSWNSSAFPALYNYLHTNGQLYRASRIPNPNIPMAGLGGRFERFNWDGSLDWQYEFSNSTYTPHHDFLVLPNGNIVFIYLEVKSASEAYAAGRDSALLDQSNLWVEALMEIEPLGVDSARVVWEWHLWDHLIQEQDPILLNYGIVAQHPELVDINYTLGYNSSDWLHANSISYNSTFDQIAISIRNMNEIWVIDHSTTTAEAAGHVGGNAGKGGDLLYRWGNPSAYQAVGDTVFEQQHDVTWVGDTSLMVYNNSISRGYASIDLIHPPLLTNGTYNSPSAGQAFAPSALNWTYELSPANSSGRLSSAQRLENGHTLICSGGQGYIFELDEQDSVVWEYINPASNTGILSQGDLVIGGNQLFKARRYLSTDPRFLNFDMSPGNPIEQNFNLTLCPNTSYTSTASEAFHLWPQPAEDYIRIESPVAIQQLQVYNSAGQLIYEQLPRNKRQLQLDLSKWDDGLYIFKLNHQYYKKVIKITSN